MNDIRVTTELWRILLNDTKVAYNELKNEKPDSNLIRYRERTFIRTVFALIEGTCFGMRSLCLKALQLPDTNKLDATTVEKLSERKRWLKLDDAVELSFASVCKVLKWPFVLDVKHPGYAALLRAKKTRNRLMHPKRAHEMLLSPKEISDAHEALKWFAHEMTRWKKSGEQSRFEK